MTERLSTMAYECIILRFAHGLFGVQTMVDHIARIANALSARGLY